MSIESYLSLVISIFKKHPLTFKPRISNSNSKISYCCRIKRGAISESELSSAEATLLNTNPSFVQTYVLVSSTKTAWETLGEELEMALKNGVDSWSPPRKCPENSKTSMYKGFEDLLQRQSQISHQVSSAGVLGKHLSIL